MSCTIALAGKGGVGKTTITGMLIKYLAEKKKGIILAVDADANSNLNEVLGVDVECTLGEIREQLEKSESSTNSPIPPSMSKADWTEMQFSRALSEGDVFDLLVMGRTQGKGCYCFVNGLLTTQIQRYSDNYKYVVVDNEAGLEHLSRGLLPKVDILLLVSDSSRRGVQAAGRIYELAQSLDIGAKEIKLIINRAPGGVAPEGALEEAEKFGMEVLGVLPQNDEIFELDGEGKPTADVSMDNEFKKKLYEVLDKMEF